MSFKKTITALLTAFACYISVVSAQPPYYFKHFGVEHGLSNNTVLCSLQDSKGFLWFGTIDGLNRFDGYTFKTFRNDPSNPKSLGNNSIYSLAQDSSQNIWIGTNKGLYRYNLIDESFQLIEPTAQQRVRSLLFDQSGLMWLHLNSVLCSYDSKKNHIRVYSQFSETTSLSTDKDDNLWIATRTGLLHRFDRSKQSLQTFDVFKKSKSEGSRFIERIHDAGNNTLLVGTLNNGIKLFDTQTGDYKDIIIYNFDKTKIFAKWFVQSAKDEFWAATEYGIFIYNTTTGNISSLRMEYNNMYSISDNAINTLFKDKEGGIWAGTRFGGINYYPHPYTSFKKYFSQDGTHSISGNGVHEICPDKKGNLWIGTEDAGLNKMNLETGKFQHFFPDGKSGSINYSNIHGLLMNGDELWIGTYQHGLDKMDLRTCKVVKHYTAGKNSFNSNFIVHLYKTKSGDIMVGTWEGLYRYNKKNDNFIPVPHFDFQTQNILEDSTGLLWICTLGNGVYTLNEQTGAIQNFRANAGNTNSLSNNMVNGQLLDSRGFLWFATEGGLCKYDPRTKQFRTYTTNDGFPSNFLFKILEDDKGYLWISSTKGLVRFSPQTESIKVFTTANGLLNDQFNWNSAYKDPSGRMYFGSVKGMISFVPAAFTQNNNIPPVYITGIQVSNKEMPVNGIESPLKKSTIYTDKIVLPHDRSTISIDFAALSYTSPEMNEYAYKMEGLDNEWTQLKTYRKAYFTGLTPGHYTFKVKAANSSGTWNNKETTLAIEIQPPLWASNWAYLLYTIAAVSLIAFIIYSYHKRFEEKNRIRLEHLEHEKEKELYKNKIEFFTNVAHEIRTPLTLIQGPMEVVMNYADNLPEIRTNLHIMERNTNRLIDIANQILDFRQTELQQFNLYLEYTNISLLLQELHISFKPLAEQHGLQYSLDMPIKDFYAYADADSLQKILSNLYSNAIKYAERKVQIKFIPTDNRYCFEIRNDGFIIPWEMRDKIFEPFFRIKETSMHKGTGIGLAISRTLATLHNAKLELKKPENNMNVFSLEVQLQEEEKNNITDQVNTYQNL